MSRILDRLLLFIYSFAVGTVSVTAIVGALGYIPGINIAGSTAVQYGFIVAAAVLFLISVRFFYLSVRRERTNLPASIDQRSEIGDIKISLETIENVALKAAGRVRGVKDLKARIHASDAGLEITIRSIVDGEHSIPVITEEVQRNVRDYVHEITGIPVSYVSVYIANIVQTPAFKARVE